jgi:hypothetical protein
VILQASVLQRARWRRSDMLRAACPAATAAGRCCGAQAAAAGAVRDLMSVVVWGLGLGAGRLPGSRQSWMGTRMRRQ